MKLGLVYVTQPGRARRRIGKLVVQGMMTVYVYDSPVPYRRHNAFGIAECVLAEMLKQGYHQIHYRYDGKTYWLTLSEALLHGFRDWKPDGHLYVRLTDWNTTEERQTYAWVNEGDTVELDWSANNVLVDSYRDEVLARAAAAKRPAAVQMQMAMGA